MIIIEHSKSEKHPFKVSTQVMVIITYPHQKHKEKEDLHGSASPQAAGDMKMEKQSTYLTVRA